MRSRFLNVDYFASRSSIGTLNRFQFLPLPVPLPPPDPCPSDPSFDLGISLDGIRIDRGITLDVDPFPIEDALSQFLSDIIPKTLPAAEDGGSLRISPRKKRFRSVPGVFEDNKVSEGSGAPDVVSEIVALLLHEERDLNGDLNLRHNELPAEDSERIELRQGIELHKDFLFEIVEIDLPLGETMGSEPEASGIHFEIPGITISMDRVNIDIEVKVIYPHKIAKSIYLVDELDAIFDEHESSLRTRNFSTVEPKLILPQFEVKTFLESDAGISSAEAFDCLLSVIGPCIGSQDDKLVVSANEFLESNSVDIMGDVSGECLMDYSHQDKPMCLNSILEMDMINIGDVMLLENGPILYAVPADGHYSHLPCSIHLQEIQNFDFHSDDVLQSYVSSQLGKTLEMTDLMVVDDINHTDGLYQSFVSTELALVDDTFKSLPTPILSDDKTMKSKSMIVEELLHTLEPHSLSACDGIYLDWHLVLEGTCSNDVCLSYINMLYNVNTCETSSDVHIDRSEIASDIEFFEDFHESGDTLQSKELPTKDQYCVQHVTQLPFQNETAQLTNQGSLNEKTPEWKHNIISDNSSVLFESMTQSNDLNFFLDVRRGTSMRNYGHQAMKGSDKKISLPIPLSQNPCFTCEIPKEKFAQWVVDVHTVTLSDCILGLMEHTQETYLTILEESPYLKTNNWKINNDYETSGLSKQNILNLIIDKVPKECISDSSHEDITTLIALYGVKKLAYFLCFFGVHAAHLYISYLIGSIKKLAGRLQHLETLLEDIRSKSDRQLIESHPSLVLIEGILNSNIHNAEKILIVAERACLGYLTNFHKILSVAFTRNISASFPFKKFGIILEYGGPYASSRLSSMVPILDGLPRVHFIHVEFATHPTALFLCEGPDVFPLFYCSQLLSVSVVSISMALTLLYPFPDTSSQSIPGVEKSLNNIIEILNFVPSEKNSCLASKSGNERDSSYENQTIRSKDINCREPCFPEAVIIVNTQIFDKKMLISRRTSYKKILAMEKAGLQIVERDVHLPLDLVLDAAVCLIWYEARNFMGSKATEDSFISMFVENMATSILISLSYSFKSCILVSLFLIRRFILSLIFEGERSFLAAIMESSDALYAAASSLDINLQLFCSHEPDSTDDIILSCIKAATSSTKGIYPAMPESESIGESFLTRFPSINPLSAHVILSSGGSLVEFLQWSNERKIQAVAKYRVPEESISLFSALCRFGEVGESKSVMTQCSSIDSDIDSQLLSSPRKKQRNVSHILPTPSDDPFLACAEPLNQNIHLKENPPSFQQHQLRNFFNIHEKMRKIDNDDHNDMLDKTARGSASTGNGLSGRNESNYRGKSFIDVINDECIFLDENLSSTSDAFNFFEAVDSDSEPTIRSSKSTSRQTQSKKDHSVFPTSEEINHHMDSFLNDHPKFDDRIFKNEHTHFNYNKDDELVINCGHYKSFMQDNNANIINLSAQEKAPPADAGNPFSNTARQSSLHGPGWFTDILNRLKEKGNKQQQTIQTNPYCNSARILDTPIKTRSPSIIDTYRYQGNNQMSNPTKRKCKKDVKRQFSNNNKETHMTILQNLYFTRNGNEKQSRLVWRSRDSPNLDSNIRKRHREDW
ncbi:hypothetical protein ZIOFF_032373 [Zingiber officinale]|uniref:Shortage in chiasmata 1 n=1 Tax=Zingiber officinale TaxID=94328 RepID=A0A8J5GNG9_ZINOF|nr:hypothetical protein ZIOFF_032373 [Zingiber officinale]